MHVVLLCLGWVLILGSCVSQRLHVCVSMLCVGVCMSVSVFVSAGGCGLARAREGPANEHRGHLPQRHAGQVNRESLSSDSPLKRGSAVATASGQSRASFGSAFGPVSGQLRFSCRASSQASIWPGRSLPARQPMLDHVWS